MHWGSSCEQHRGCILPLRRVKDSWLQPSGIKVGRGEQKEPWSTLEGDPTRGDFQEEVMFKPSLEGWVTITQQTWVGEGRALQVEIICEGAE